MKNCLARSFGTALFIVSAAQVANAEVTAEDVWGDWKNYLTGFGYEVTGTEISSGGTLTVSDVSVVMEIPEADGTITMGMASLVFVGNSDGTVSVALPGNMPMQFAGKGEDGQPFEVEFGYAQSGNSLVVSGDPDDMTYVYAASRVDVTLNSLSIAGQQIPASVGHLTVALGNVSSKTRMQLAEGRTYTQRMSADSLSYDMAFKDPDSGDQGTFKGNLQGLGFEGTSMIPLVMDTADFAAMLQQGFGFDGAFTYAAGNTNTNVDAEGDTFAAVTSSQGGKFGMVMNAAHLVYDFAQNGVSIEMTSSEIPLPIKFNLAQLGLLLDMPIAKSEQEQDFGFTVRLGDFTMSDMLWGMFDPGAVLPRDPATIVLDLTGKAKILVDIFDPEMAGNLTGPPGELNAITIKELLVSAVGSRLSGTGAFTFNNNDLETFDGFPAPVGTIEMELTGANGLLDNLVKMGLMSDQDAMGGRMMMGMLTVPGEGPDSLKSKIEINEQGNISANGQRLK